MQEQENHQSPKTGSFRDANWPTPWDPNRIFGFVVLVSSIVVGIVLGLNWRRLGKPEWVNKTILLSILIPGGSIALALVWFLIFIKDMDLPIQFIASIPFLALGINFGYAWGLARLQDGAYRTFQSYGWEALTNYTYNIRGAVIFGLVVALVIAMACIIILPALA